MPDRETIDRRLPLSARMFHLLLALADGPQNGYRAANLVEDNSGGRVRLSPATLYENLHRLQQWGFIEEARSAAAPAGDGRGQRFYALTTTGRRALAIEVERMRHAVGIAAQADLGG